MRRCDKTGELLCAVAPGSSFHWKSISKSRIGAIGENMVITKMVQMGMNPGTFFIDDGVDLFNVNKNRMVVPIQVKTATPAQSKGDNCWFAWSIEGKHGTGRQGMNDYYVFVALCESNRFFVVPSDYLIGRKSIQWRQEKVRPDKRPHWIEDYEDRWDLLS